MSPDWGHVPMRFEQLLRQVSAPAEQQQQHLRAARDVGLLLARRFAPAATSARSASGPRVIGSVAKGTALRGHATVDLLFVLPDRCRPAADPPLASCMCPPAVYDLASVLAARFGAVESGRDGWFAVHWGSSSRHGGSRSVVRVIPAFACSAGGLLTPTRPPQPGCGPWRQIDPEAEREALDRIDALTDRKARHLIRLAKAWAREVSLPMAPLALERLCCEFAGQWIYRRRSVFFYDWMVRDFFFWLGAQEGRSLALPGTGEVVTTGEGWRALADRAYAHAREAAEAERQNREEGAIAGWARLFGSAALAAPRVAPRAQPTALLIPAMTLAEGL